MVRQVLRFAAGIRDAFHPVLLILLAAAWMAPDSRLIQLLQGHSSIAKELSQSETRAITKACSTQARTLIAIAARSPAPCWQRIHSLPLPTGSRSATRDCLKPRPGTCSGGSCPTSMCAGTERPSAPTVWATELPRSPSTSRPASTGSWSSAHRIPWGMELTTQPYTRACWNDGSTSAWIRDGVWRWSILPSRANPRHADCSDCTTKPAGTMPTGSSATHRRWTMPWKKTTWKRSSAAGLPSRSRSIMFAQRRKREKWPQPTTRRRSVASSRPSTKPCLTVRMPAGAESDRLKVPVSVVILPRADRERQSPVITSLMRTLASRHGLDILDLSDAFDDMEVKEFRVSAWDRHPSVQGHRALFEALRDEISERDGLPTTASTVQKIASGRASRLAYREAAVMGQGKCN